MVTKTINACLFIKTLEIGRQMENNYRQIIFDCSGFGEDIAEITLVHQRSKDEAPYIVTTSAGETLTWDISNTDTAYAGLGQAELRISFASGLAKSIVYATHVIESITGDTVIPSALQSWYDALIEYIDEHAASPEQIAEAVADYIETHPIDAPVQSVNGQTGTVVLTASDVGALPDSTVIPTVPTNVSAFTNDAGYLTAVPSEYVTDTELNTALAPKANTADLATVATSGDYADLTGKPTIPTVPSNVSAFTNDANYITASQAPVQSVNGQTGAVTVPNTTYTISISGNVITLTPSSGTAQSITLPVYSGGVI